MAEPVYLRRQGFDLSVIRAYESGYEVYAQVISTTDRLLAHEPEALTRFLKVTFDGWRHALTHPAEAAGVITQYYLPEASAEAEAETLSASRSIIEGDLGLNKLGWMTSQRWAKSIGYLAAHHLIDQPLRAEDVMTNSFMEQADALTT